MTVTSPYLVFLDIDGVFTSSRVHEAHNASYPMWHRFDPIAVDFMNFIHDTYDVQFVLISTWKLYIPVDSFQTYHWIRSAFGNAGFRGDFAETWKTLEADASKPRSYDRAHEIRDYLAAYGKDVKDYIIFDDTDYDFESVLGKRRLIRTDSVNGMLHKHMLNAKAIMGEWDKK